MSSHSDEDLLEGIRCVADVADADGAPTVVQFNEHSDIADTIHRRFGSWNEGVAKAGFDPNPPETAIDDADLVDEFRQLCDGLGHLPTKDEMNEHGAHWTETYEKHYGSWTAALLEVFDDITESDLDRRRANTVTGRAGASAHTSQTRSYWPISRRLSTNSVGHPPPRTCANTDRMARTRT